MLFAFFFFSNTAKAQVSELILLTLFHTCDKQHNKLVLTKQPSSLKSKLQEKDQIVKENFHLCTFCCFALLVDATLSFSLPMVGIPFLSTLLTLKSSIQIFSYKISRYFPFESFWFLYKIFHKSHKINLFSFVAGARFPFHTLNAP